MVADLYALSTVESSAATPVDLTITPGQDAKLHHITCRFSAAPVTSEDFEVWADYASGSEFSSRVLSTDPSDGSVQDFVFFPDNEFYFAKGDSIRIVYPNSDARTVSIQAVMEVEQ